MEGCIKINCDASLPKDGLPSVAFIGRDEHGVFLFAGVKPMAGASEVEIVEADAVLWALQFAKERGLRRVQRA